MRNSRSPMRYLGDWKAQLISVPRPIRGRLPNTESSQSSWSKACQRKNWRRLARRQNTKILMRVSVLNSLKYQKTKLLGHASLLWKRRSNADPLSFSPRAVSHHLLLEAGYPLAFLSMEMLERPESDG